MKIDYQKTYAELKAKGVIKPDDKYALCLFVPETKNYGVASTTVVSKVDFIIIANNNEVKLLELDRKTGQYLGKGLIFKKENLVFEKENKNWVIASKGMFGGLYISIRADFVGKFMHSYVLPKKMNGFEQREARLELYNFIKENYNAHRDSQKKLYKEKQD